MNLSMATTRLWWKESRQILPLLISLPCLAITIVIVAMLVENRFHPGAFVVVLIWPPMFFAVAAGAMLVGQEKETRSLNWLSALPISPQRLIVSKLVIANVGLVMLWLLPAIGSVATYTIDMWLGLRWSEPLGDGELAIISYMFLHSFYLLFCGFATTWFFRSAMVSLVAIVPLAFLPTLADMLMNDVYLWAFPELTYRFIDLPPWLTFATVSMGVFASVWTAYRAAKSNLDGPQPLRPGPLSWKQSLSQVLSRSTNIRTGRSFTKDHPATTNGSLLWQFRTQNRAVVWSCYAVLLVGFAVAINDIDQHGAFQSFRDMSRLPAIWILPCSVCGMALFAFQGDSARGQIRFLAERGVSPNRVWLSRQVFPLCFFCLVVGLTLILISSGSFKAWQRPETRLPRSTVIICLGITYSISQWIGQVIKRLPIAFASSIAISCAAISSASFSLDELEIPMSLMVVSLIVLPLAATFWMTQRWMDGRTGSGFWYQHAAIAVIAFILSNVVWQAGFLMAPSISTEKREILMADVKRYQSSQMPTKQVGFLTNKLPFGGGQQDLHAALLLDENAWLEAQYEHLSVQCDSRHAIEYNEIYRLLGIIVKLRFGLDNEDVDRAQPSDQGLTVYQDWMLLAQKVAAGLRRSPKLISQEQADRIEIFLLAELERFKTAERLGRDTLAAIANQVGDADARWEARRRALLLSWKSDGPSLGWYWDMNSPTIYQTDTRQRQTDLLVVSLVNYIDEARSGRGELPIQSLIDWSDFNPEVYGIGPAGPYFRIDEFSKSSVQDYTMALASQWGAGWEVTGKSCLKGLHKND